MIKNSLRYIIYVSLLVLFTLPAFAKNTILVVGDSLSAGYGLQIEEGWVHLLALQIKQHGYDYQVINSSVSGNTTSNGLSRLPALLKEYQPAITLIELGGNDGLRGIQLLAITINLQKMITLIQDAGSKVILLGVRLPPNYGADYIEQFQKMYVSLADKNGAVLVPNILLHIDDRKELMSADGIHPVNKAQPIMMQNVWELLHPLL